ncbi:MAG: ATP phosphoribosyltransferase regulatory subunit [Oscillospiraceae bacterium]|nr:ATP phosphoribosyltransferase regulatory subunit [Oscillospiraceae bacterium]
MKKNNLITPEGTRDLLFDECRARREIESELMELFKNEGYSEVITPFLEFYDVFSGSPNGGMQGFPQESMYKLTDSKGRLMVIRPDSTQPIIRLAETRLKNEPRPLKLCYNQTIYRANPKDAGRDDEIMQSGIEILDGAGGKSDSEAVSLAVMVLKKLGIDFRFEIGDCSFFNLLSLEAGMSEDEAEEIRPFVETKNFPELSRLTNGMLARLPRLFGGEEVFNEAEKLFKSNALQMTLEKLKGVYEELRGNGLEEKITVDLGLTNKRGYYTGILFNGYAQGYGKPVLSGGRYLINKTEGIGFAVNVSAIAELRGNK